MKRLFALAFALALGLGPALGADRYWVGGTGNWDTFADTKWATSSGGAGGASAPVAGDNVFFDAASGSGTVTLVTAAVVFGGADFSGFTGTIAGSATRTFAGPFTLGAGMTNNWTGTLTFAPADTVPTQIVTLNGKAVAGVQVDSQTTMLNVTRFADTFTTTGQFSLVDGTADFGSSDLVVGTFLSSNTNTRGLLFSAGATVTMTSNGNIWNTGSTAGLTYTPPDSFIVTSTDTSLKVFNPGGLDAPVVVLPTNGVAAVNLGAGVYGNVVLGLGTPVGLTSNGATINAIDDSALVGSRGVLLMSNSPGSSRTLTIPGPMGANNLAVSDVTVTGGTLTVTNGLDIRGNSGITFVQSGGGGGGGGQITRQGLGLGL